MAEIINYSTDQKNLDLIINTDSPIKQDEVSKDELNDILRQTLRFTSPGEDTVLNPVPLMASHIESGISVILERPRHALHSYSSTVYNPGYVETAQQFLEMQAAQRTIEAKAGQLGWTGAVTADFADAGAGYVIRYQHADIYYSKETGAHVVHGDIRAKYNFLGAAASVLGLPVTDETGTPDGRGRYNHFQGGSIYWRSDLGPMMVRGPIRDLWASQGWELGPFGYPVADPHRKVLFTPAHKPEEHYGYFENGAIYSKGNDKAAAFIAELLPHELAHVVRKAFDKALKEEDGDLGIEGGINTLGVSGWGFDFVKSRKRMITYEIHGFYSNGLPGIPDPTFRLELEFLFYLDWKWQSFAEEGVDKVLVIHLNRLRVSTSGVGHGTLFSRLNEGISRKFPFAFKSIPAAALLMDVLLTPHGGLQFLLEPGVDFPGSGSHRRDLFQGELNSLLEE